MGGRQNENGSDKQIQHETNLGLGMKRHHMIFATSFVLTLGNSQLASGSAPSMLESLSRTEKLILEILTPVEWPFWCVAPLSALEWGPAFWAPGYMMEHVKPQHSFRRVRPVLVKGEEAC